MFIAKCWSCGSAITSMSVYKKYRGDFYVCGDCLGKCKSCGEMHDLVGDTGKCEFCLSGEDIDASQGPQ